MFTSIDVVGVDPETAGESLTDFLQTAGLVALWSAVAVAVLIFVVAIAVSKKAGYSGWWGAIGVLFPPVGVILLLLLALLKWPALKERDEALGVLTENGLTLPSHERAAIKEAERKKAVEDEARRRREKADAERARFNAKQAEAPAAVEPAPAQPKEVEAKPASVKPAEAPVQPAPTTTSGEQPVTAGDK